MTNFRREKGIKKSNYYFRKFECGLSKEEAAKLCFRTVRCIKEWDKGKTIPPECKRLMRMAKGRKFSSHHSEWDGWGFNGQHITTPDGMRLSPDQIITGVFIMQCGAERELAFKMLKFARSLKSRP